MAELRRWRWVLPILAGALGCGAGSEPEKCNINSGFAGDDLCLPKPPAERGFQLHYGPADYRPESVAPYLLQPGDETTDCIFVKTPNTGEVFLSEYHGRLRVGSHHMIVYEQGMAMPDSTAPEACATGTDLRFLVGAQTQQIDIPDGVVAPENQGMAMKLGPKIQTAIQLHFINASPKPLLREAWINLIYADPKTVKVASDAIELIAGLSAHIEPRTDALTTGSCTAPQPIRIVSISGHFHAHTTRMTVWKVAGGEKTPIFESHSWEEPGSLSYDSVHDNPPIDPNTTVGGVSGLVDLAQGDQLQWECAVHNDSADELIFQDSVYKGEMCNLFGVYSPSMNMPWSCFNF